MSACANNQVSTVCIKEKHLKHKIILEFELLAHYCNWTHSPAACLRSMLRRTARASITRGSCMLDMRFLGSLPNSISFLLNTGSWRKARVFSLAISRRSISGPEKGLEKLPASTGGEGGGGNQVTHYTYTKVDVVSMLDQSDSSKCGKDLQIDKPKLLIVKVIQN